MTVPPGDFAPMQVADRAERVRAALARTNDPADPVDSLEQACDALLVTNLVNVRYLTGFTGSAGLLWLGLEEMLLVTDRRYEQQAPAELAAAGVDARVKICNTKQTQALASQAAGAARIALEADSVSWADQQRYAEAWAEHATLVPTSGLVEAVRAVKDDGETDRMQRAAAIADAALAEVLPMLAERPAEQDVAQALDAAMRRRGASASAFQTIVASGPNAALPHARPGVRTVQPDELVIIDMGAVVDGYRSDMTRTVATGDPDPQALRVFETVREAQRLGVEQLRHGVPLASVDQACRRHIAEAGWAEAFVHGTGHGVGLDVHELPWVRAMPKAGPADQKTAPTAEAGQVLTVEPGVYLPGNCGARVEDTLLVTDTGARPLTRAPKQLLVA